MTVVVPGKHVQRGFSLLELMVALGIVALLLTVLLPALSFAREQGYRAVCASNQRQLGVALQQYVMDHQRFPQTPAAPEWHYGGVDFRDRERSLPVLASDRPINRYISDRQASSGGDCVQIFRCPGDRGVIKPAGDQRRGGPSVLGDLSCFQAFGTSFRANDKLVDPARTTLDASTKPLKDGDIAVDRAKLLVLGDAEWYYASRPAGNIERLLRADWHSAPGWGNMLSADGSVHFVHFVHFEALPAPFVLAPR